MCLKLNNDGGAVVAANESVTRDISLLRRKIGSLRGKSRNRTPTILYSPKQMQASINEEKFHLLLFLQHHLPQYTEHDMLLMLTLHGYAPRPELYKQAPGGER